MRNEQSKEQIVSYIEKASVAILGILFILFPLVFTNITTDLFVLPKQAFLIFVVLILMILYGVRTFFAEKVRIRRTPFDLPILLFVGATLLSVVFSVAKFDSLYNFVPLLLAALSYFTITYNIRNEKSLFVLIGSLLAGGALVSLISIFSFLKIYIFPLDFTKSQTFTTLGSSLDQAIYLGFMLVLGAYFIYMLIKKKNQDMVKLVGLSIMSVILLLGFIVSIYISATLQKPVILPLATGFQTAFAAISQDGGRVIQGFLFGSGFGEFSIVFSKFKQATFNASPTIWNLTFFRSTSFVLELLATTGLLGLLSFIFIVFKAAKEKPLFIPLAVLIVTSFVLPFSFYHIAVLFFFLGIYSSVKGLSNGNEYFDVEIQLVASKKGFFVLSAEEVSSQAQEKYGRALSSIVLGIIALFAIVFGFLTYDFLLENVNFQKSLVFASQNNGSLTYTNQSNVLNSFTGRYVDAYYRVFSQTNLALANSLATSVPKNSTPSAQTTQTINTLVQQSINAARSATTVSKNNALNWQNLSSVYRALIGFGQNADSFAILAAQQSIQLDPTNPQEYINLGGIYYQLGSYENAITQFQQAIVLKPDLPNAYYNYAHALIQKGDLKGGLTQLQTVKSLVANDPTNAAKIDQEIKTLEAQIAQGSANGQVGQNQTLETNQQPVLPAQNPPVKIPAPTTNVKSTPAPSLTPTPAP